MTAPCLDCTKIVAEHGDFLFHLAFRKLRDKHLAEDIVQETFLAAIKNQASYNGEGSIKGWLASILSNKVIDYVRKAVRETPLPEDTDQLSNIFTRFGTWSSWFFQRWNIPPDQGVEHQQLGCALMKCIDKLPTKLRLIFLARHQDDLDSGEICEKLEISQASLDTSMFRARLLLRQCLNNNWFKEGR